MHPFQFISIFYTVKDYVEYRYTASRVYIAPLVLMIVRKCKEYDGQKPGSERVLSRLYIALVNTGTVYIIDITLTLFFNVFFL